MSAFAKKWLLFLLGLSPLLAEGQQFSYEVNANTREIFPGGQITLYYILNNASGEAFKSPAFGDLQVVQGPSISNEMRIVNGRRSSRQVYQFRITGSVPGTYTIAGATVMVNGRTINFEDIEINILEPPEGTNNPRLSGDQRVFVEATLSKDTAYPGECIYMDYTLYTRVDIRSYDMLSIPDLTGFYHTGPGLMDKSVYRVEIDGKTYNRKLLRRILLYPQKSGSYAIGSANIRLELVPRGQRRSFLSFPNYRSEIVNTNPLKLEVIPLPPAPPDYIGVIGPLEVDLVVDKTKVTTDDDVSLRMIIRSFSDRLKLSMPSLNLGDDVVVYDPEIIKEARNQLGGRLEMETHVEYNLLFEQSGTYMIRPNISYFNTDSNTFVQYPIDSIIISVSPGDGRPSMASPKVTDRMDIPTVSKTRLKARRAPFFGSPLHLALLIIPLMALGITKAGEYHRQLRKHSRPQESLLERSVRHIDERELTTVDAKGYYEGIRFTLEKYASEKLKINISDLSKTRLREALLSSGIGNELTERFMELLHQCETAVYSGGLAGGKKEDIARRAKDILRKLEEHMPKS